MKHASLVVAIICASILLISFANHSAEAAIKVALKPIGIAISNGTAVQISLSITCDPFGELLEALVTLTSPDVFGEGFFGSVVCDGLKHSYLVTVRPPEGTFDVGKARASAFVLFCDDVSQDCIDGQDTREIRIKKSKHNP